VNHDGILIAGLAMMNAAALVAWITYAIDNASKRIARAILEANKKDAP